MLETKTKISRLSRKSYVLYGMGVSYAILDQIYNQWISYYYLPPETEKSLVPLLKSSYLVMAFVFARLIDAISDPLVGYWSDNNKSKFGKRSIFMMLGGLPLGIFMVMYFYPPKTSQLSTFLYLSVIGGLFFIAYTLVGGPYNSLIPDLSNTKEERLNLSTVQSIFRLIFTGIALILPGILIKTFGHGNTEMGIRKTVMFLSAIAVIGIYVCIFGLKEKELVKDKPKKKSLSFIDSLKALKEKEIILYFCGYFFFFSGFNILRGILTYYVTIVMKQPLENVSLVSVVLFGVAGICFPITNKLGKKYSYKKILMVDIILLGIGTIGLIFGTDKTNVLAYTMFVICGLGLSGSAFIFPQAMLSEITAKLAEIKNISLEGFLFGIQGLFLKISFLIQQVISSTILVIGSAQTSNGLKSATFIGVKITLIMTLIFFIISLTFYSMKKDD